MAGTYQFDGGNCEIIIPPPPIGEWVNTMTLRIGPLYNVIGNDVPSPELPSAIAAPNKPIPDDDAPAGP